MRILIIGLLLTCVACNKTPPGPRVGKCFTEVERKEGWEQQDIKCNYRPDSVSHEVREFSLPTASSQDTINPWSYRPRHRRF